MRRKLWILTVLGGIACTPKSQATHRMEMRKATNNTVGFVPGKAQLPYCLIFTRSQKGTLRQMTMTRMNQSVSCKPDEPVMNVRFRIPVDEGKVQALVFFSDQRLNATRVAEQLIDYPADRRLSAMDY